MESDVVVLDEDETVEKIPATKLYTFLMRAGIRLSAKNSTVCSAILMMHRIRDRPIMGSVCNYTLASAALLLAGKLEEDSVVGIRDVCNVAHSILHPDEPFMPIDSFLTQMRMGISTLEFVLLRELKFELEFDHPYRHLSLFLDQLQNWLPKDFSQRQLAEKCIAVCRDCYISPEFVLSHSPASLAIACIAVVFAGNDITVPHCREWYEILHETMTSSKLERIIEELLEEVYPLQALNGFEPL